jgi:hypothetical protein
MGQWRTLLHNLRSAVQLSGSQCNLVAFRKDVDNRLSCALEREAEGEHEVLLFVPLVIGHARDAAALNWRSLHCAHDFSCQMWREEKRVREFGWKLRLRGAARPMNRS